MKSSYNRLLLASVILVSSLTSGCALLGPLLGMMSGAGNLMMTGQETAQSNASYRVTTNPVYQDGSHLYGFYADKSGASH
jgi:hypothetical protein